MKFFHTDSQKDTLISLLKLSGPIVLANILQTAYQLIDTFWLGRLGANAVAAVSLSFPVLFLIISLGIGLTLGGSIMVAQYKGMENQRMVDYSSAQTFFVLFFISILLALLGYFISKPLMIIIGAKGEVLTEAVSYFKVSSIGFIFLFLFFVFQSLMRGIGNVVIPTYVVLSTVILNLFLDPLFIYGWGPLPPMGVSGAAMASVLTQGLSALMGILILSNGKFGIQLHWSDFKFNLNWSKELIRIGIPSSLEMSTRALGLTMLVTLVTGFGSIVVASYGIGARILSFVIIPALGLSAATTTLVGQYVGANRINKADDVGILSVKVAFFGLTIVGFVLFLIAKPLTAFFVPGETQVIENGALFIKIMAPSFGLLGIQQVINGVFNGAGFTLASLLVSILSLWIIRFPLAYLLSHNTELSYDGIWWAFPVSNLIAAIFAFVWFKRGDWKKRKKVSVDF
ncbi:putative MATE family efflux protein [Catalinimonas alkaloidigena]|uniref:MATE family efflux transporter n=1 Tax=Catalinimonas alkaloidigena TaxID=1075417 RepID=UPI0024056A0F|nr:MATE family efflux transporter [Catalinimonas alkaloidigena]MDF9797454.1 putative MATE family efflux protein [Catalinimonas alkaloidigena]